MKRPPNLLVGSAELRKSNSGIIFAVHEEAAVASVTGLKCGDVVYQPYGRVKEVTKPLPFEVGKTYKMRNGGTCRVICIDRTQSGRLGEFAIVGLRKNDDTDTEYPELFSITGHFYSAGRPGQYDLFPETATTFEVVPFTDEDK